MNFKIKEIMQNDLLLERNGTPRITFRSGAFSLFHDGGRYHIEASPLICSANQWTGFYTITAKSMDWFLYDNDLHHERVKQSKKHSKQSY